MYVYVCVCMYVCVYVCTVNLLTLCHMNTLGTNEGPDGRAPNGEKVVSSILLYNPKMYGDK